MTNSFEVQKSESRNTAKHHLRQLATAKPFKNQKQHNSRSVKNHHPHPARQLYIFSHTTHTHNGLSNKQNILVLLSLFPFLLSLFTTRITFIFLM